MGGGGGLGGMVGGAQSGGPMGAWGAYESQQGAQDAARAAGRAGEAQLRAANSAFKEMKGIINPATTAGLASLDRDIANQEKNLARQEQLISQIDPTIMEASQQALRLLKGETSSYTKNTQDQRSQQRQKLLNSLREQLGPGAETSTAGIQALTKFDSESNNLFSGQQQNALQMLGNLGGQFTAMRPDMLREITGLSNFGQAKTNLSFDQANTLFKGRQPMIGSAGGQFAGDLMMGQYRQAAGNQMQQQAAQNQQQAMQIGAMFMGSDRRFKTSIVRLVKSVFRDVPTYIFRYVDQKMGQGLRYGVMAQDLIARDPNHPAVAVDSNGYYYVDYAKLERV